MKHKVNPQYIEELDLLMRGKMSKEKTLAYKLCYAKPYNYRVVKVKRGKQYDPLLVTYVILNPCKKGLLIFIH